MQYKFITYPHLILGLIMPLPSLGQEAVRTAFGVLSINEDKILLIDGKKTTPVVKGDFSLYFEKTIQYGKNIAVLIGNNSGGTNCPVQFRWVIIGEGKVSISDEFGSCSDIVQVAIKDEILIAEFPTLRSAGTETIFYDGSTFLQKKTSITSNLRQEAEVHKDNQKQIKDWAKKNTQGFICGKIESTLSKTQLINDFFKGGRCSKPGQATLTIACNWTHRIILARKDGDTKWQIASWMSEISINPLSPKWVHFDLAESGNSRVAQSVDGVTERELHMNDGMLYEKKGRRGVVTYKCYDFQVGDY